MKKNILALLALVLISSPAFAQSASDAKLADASLDYRMTLNVMGQQLVVPITRTVTKEDGVWRIVDLATLPDMAGGGTAVDTFDVKTGTLLPARRASSSMGGTLTLDYHGSHVKGGMASMMGSVDIDTMYTGVTLVGDGGAFDLYLAGLALADGFDETFAVYSPQMQALRMTQVQVTGMETVTTPAGEFETFVVTTTPQDGNEAGASTYYVTQSAPHMVVKATSKLGAQMGNGTAVMELQSKK